VVNVTRIVTVRAVAGGVLELELQGGARIKSGRQYGDGIRSLLEAGRK